MEGEGTPGRPRRGRVEQDWGIITAGAVLASLPVLLLYIPVQKYVISGLTAGSVLE